ncbi:CYTH and CHAD domain-containing protein [Phyllobacterium myrsinacearum]|uniref:Inorganic triphosphatase YgiF n=1 Tax=Phyllobacterium myrsinacearum TaxID=28101 RepID=A0A839EQI2_9HYPH|nr:CYTH and CHAD domain-containing protein [Phyllobacterium myrsinacearum]MBA8879764.1 inorganic triphosphatase YgiF [Phyllobacterium myrsinacearum]
MVALVQGTDVRSGTDAAAVTADVPTETELKLRAPAGTLEDIRQSAVVQQFARNKGSVRRLEAIYYDTPDHRLFAAGLSLRVRREGRRYIQTVKRAAVHGSLQRHEWEVVVAGMTPELAALPVDDIGQPLAGIAESKLVSMFATRVRRHTLLLDQQETQIEMALDEGDIVFGQTSLPLCEVELELKRGKVAALYQFGLGLMDILPLSFETQSKSARGYALAVGDNASAVKAAPSGLGRSDTVDDGIIRLLSNCHQQIIANLAAARDGREPEGIHQLRVALRRLRVTLHFLCHHLESSALQGLDAEAKLFGQALGPARNWDVFIGSTLPGIEEAGLPQVHIAALRAACTSLHDQAYHEVRDVLDAPRTNRFLLSFGLVIEQKSWRNDISGEELKVLTEPMGQFATRVLDRIEQQVRKRGRGFRRLQPDERHRLRLGLKKLRYASDFFLPLYSRRAATTKYLKRLSRLQDLLGEANDISTTQELLATLEHDALAPQANRAVGTVIGWQGHLQTVAIKRLNSRWEAFKDTAPFWS